MDLLIEIGCYHRVRFLGAVADDRVALHSVCRAAYDGLAVRSFDGPGVIPLQPRGVGYLFKRDVRYGILARAQEEGGDFAVLEPRIILSPSPGGEQSVDTKCRRLPLAFWNFPWIDSRRWTTSGRE